MTSISMPRAMRWLLVVLVGQLTVDIGALTFGEPSESALAIALEVGALGVDAVVLLLLARATELTRVMIRAAAGVGMAIDAWILFGALTWMPRDPEGMWALATSAGLVAASAFAWIVLGRTEVHAWIFARWLQAQGHDDPVGPGEIDPAAAT